ncbi:hypothetical protein FXO38_25391 [Capsicum annuum]|nr:hypothetical protein FXO38_25391 [Capsicum annuum]
MYGVLSFDCATELFGKISGPPIPGDYNWATLLLLGGSLADMATNDVVVSMYVFELTETGRLVFYDQSVKQATNLGFDFFKHLRSGWAWPFDYKESLFPIPLGTKNPTEQDNDEYFFRKVLNMHQM